MSSATPPIDEDLDLAELLTRDAHGAGRHLQLADGRDLVSLDVGAVADAVLGEMRLHPANVVLHDAHVDGDGGRLEIADGGHGRLPCRVRVLIASNPERRSLTRRIRDMRAAAGNGVRFERRLRRRNLVPWGRPRRGPARPPPRI